MSLHKKIARQLESLSRNDDFVATAIVAKHERHELRIDLLAVDSIGCAFDALEFRSQDLQDRSATEMHELADRLASQLTYLLEPIRAVETDQEQRTVQLRSERPRESDEGRFYYEIVARPGTIRLCRFVKTPGQARARTPSHVTREVLLRLVDDLSAVTS